MNKSLEKLFEFDNHLTDSRLTMPSDNKHYDIRAAIRYHEKIDRVLTDEEIEMFLVKEEKTFI